MTKYTLFTGSTGLVGRYLVRDLLLEGHRLALVVRPTQKQTPQERVESILQMWESELGKHLPRPVCFEGDVHQEGLGLDRETRRWITKHCDRVIHNAASLTFHGNDRQGEPWNTNLLGTQHTLELCRDVKLRNLHYISTAYVSGNRQGIVKEDEFDLGKNFRNDYEHSKFLAEQSVRKADFLDQLTVYRPAVIAGDSRSGYTNTYHGIYLYLRFIALMVPLVEPDANGIRHTVMRLNLHGDEHRNIVPVDWVSSVLSRLFNTPKSHGGTYHLAPTDPITPRQIVEYSCKYYNSTGIEFHGHDFHPEQYLNDFERAYYASVSMYEAYQTTDPCFDRTNLLKFTADLPCPRIDEIMLHRYLHFGERDRWGKRRPAPLNIPFSVGDYLKRFVSNGSLNSSSNGNESHGNGKITNLFEANGSGQHQWVGLEVSGPGGGQWSLSLRDGKIRSIEPGLLPNCCAMLCLASEEFADFTQGRVNSPLKKLGKNIQIFDKITNGELTESLFHALFSDISFSATTSPAILK